MASLLIRNVDTALHVRLKARAAAHHRSLEEEVRELLRAGLARSDSAPDRIGLPALASRLFGPTDGIDLDLPTRDPALNRPPPDFATKAG
jgi:plasmid stability protein